MCLWSPSSHRTWWRGCPASSASPTPKPVTDRVFPFERVGDALAHLEEGRAKGKVVAEM
ncbi:zinc-binding dehydrogenase [Actinorhabdospora filicis]|uniref:zinc-binding dehydrogenase n=1 Tax=Actinorhabdospora filicis TaxID=1785913 RepID=UPI002555DC81|nr:zinc-binding dehydrogenase [Actinorhabdospora filicis]